MNTLTAETDVNKDGNHADRPFLRRTAKKPLKVNRRISILPAVIATFVIAFLQIALWPTKANVTTIAGCSAGILLAFAYLSRRHRWIQFPLSTISLSGFPLYYFILPPIVTLAEQQPAASHLVSSENVAVHSLVGFVTLLAAHYCYTRLSLFRNARKRISAILSSKVMLYASPTLPQALMIGLLSLAAGMLNMGANDGDSVVAGGSITMRVLHQIAPFLAYPYVLILPSVFGVEKAVRSRLVKPSLAAYTALVVIYGAMIGSRSVLFASFAAVTIAAIWGHLSGVSRSWLFKPVPILCVLVAFGMFMTQANDLATAMVIARNDDSALHGIERAKRMFATFLDKEAIRRYEIQARSVDRGIESEIYVDNPIFARLCNLRFLDISLDLASHMNADQVQEMRLFETQRTLSTLPQPVLSTLGIQANKSYVSSMSSGDKMLFVVTGNPYFLGGFRTGSMLGNGYAVLGWLYPLLLFVIAVPTYFLLDTFALQLNGSRSVLSPLCITILFKLLFHWTSAATGSESISEPLGFIGRGWIQTIVLYLGLFWATKALADLLRIKNL